MIHYGLENKICLVTGGSRGIGKSIVNAFIQQKAHVILISRHAKKEKGCYVYNADLMEAGAVRSVCDQLIEEVGIPDVVIHNLGGSYEVKSDFADVEDWSDVWKFNLGVSVGFNRILFPLFLKDKKLRKVIHLSSAVVNTLNGYTPYITAKAGVEAYVKAMSLKYSEHGILINAVSPGAVSLPGRYFSELQKNDPGKFDEFLKNHIAMRRLAKPEEVAAVVLFLASQQASYMTGSILQVDGGIY